MADETEKRQVVKRISLRKPIRTAGGEITTEMDFLEPQVSDFRDLDPTQPIEFACRLIERLARKPRAVVNMMGAEDYQEAADLVNGFFGSAPRTSKTA